jgi:hypothetical protein
MEEYFLAFKRLMIGFREEFDSFLENMEKVWASIGSAGVDGSDPAVMKKHEAFGPKDGPGPGQPVNHVSRGTAMDKVSKEGQANMDHEKPKSRPFSVKPPIRLISYVRRRASKKVWRVKRKGRGSSPAAGEIPLSNRCGSPVPATSINDIVVQAGADSLAGEDDLVDGAPLKSHRRRKQGSDKGSGSCEIHAGEVLASDGAKGGVSGMSEGCDVFQATGYLPETRRSGPQKSKYVSMSPECTDKGVGSFEVIQNGLGLSSLAVSLSMSPNWSFQSMVLGKQHLKVLKDQGMGSKSVPCAIVLPFDFVGSCVPWRTEVACLEENVDSREMAPFIQAKEKMSDIVCVGDITEIAAEQCAAEEVQEVAPLTTICGHEWLYDKVKELFQVWGMSCEGCEEELKALYHKIEGNRRKVHCPAMSPTKSSCKGSRELRGLHSSVNYDGKMGLAIRDQHTKKRARGGRSIMSNDA